MTYNALKLQFHLDDEQLAVLRDELLIGGEAKHEQLALGETPNLAARLQGLAAPNTMVISAATLPLLGGFFACQSLGTHLLKGFAQPIEVYQGRYESMALSRLEAAGRTGLTPLVGREAEVGLLRERWAQVKEGLGRVALRFERAESSQRDRASTIDARTTHPTLLTSEFLVDRAGCRARCGSGCWQANPRLNRGSADLPGRHYV